MTAPAPPALAARRRRRPVVLIVDADRRVRRSLAELLRLGGVAVAATAADTDEALGLAATRRPDLVLLDEQLHASQDGPAFAARLRARCPAARLVLMGWPSEGSAEATGGSARYISKAAPPTELLRRIVSAVPAAE